MLLSYLIGYGVCLHVGAVSGRMWSERHGRLGRGYPLGQTGDHPRPVAQHGTERARKNGGTGRRAGSGDEVTRLSEADDRNIGRGQRRCERKLGVASRSEAIGRAIELRLLCTTLIAQYLG